MNLADHRSLWLVIMILTTLLLSLLSVHAMDLPLAARDPSPVDTQKRSTDERCVSSLVCAHECSSLFDLCLVVFHDEPAAAIVFQQLLKIPLPTVSILLLLLGAKDTCSHYARARIT